jgi:hypothetical protein
LSVLIAFPIVEADGAVLLVEANSEDLPGELVLASPQPGEVTARAARTLSDALAQLEPMIRTVKDRLAASSPDAFAVEFGVKLGGETGIILAKGTAEVNLKVTMSWNCS